MALAIDTTRVANHMSTMQKFLDSAEGGLGRYQIQRICIYATVLVNRNWLQCSFSAKGEALDWQADPDDVQDDLEVLHRLKQQAATMPLHSQFASGGDGMEPATTLVASVHSSLFAAKTRGRLLPSFHRCSLRSAAGFTCSETGSGLTVFETSYTRNLPPPFCEGFLGQFPSKFEYVGATIPFVGAKDARPPQFVSVQWQADVVDLFSRRSLPTSRPGKRRRAAINAFLEVSDPPVIEAKSRGNHLPHEKKFNGVRCRHEQRRWEAMMKPPKFPNKHYFGSFKVEAQAARAVDAAFHHYGRPDLLNFPHSSPLLLATRPAAGADLDKSAMLRFVKDEAKWLASVAPDPPLPVLTANSLPAPVPQPPTSSLICLSPQLRPLTEILCSVGDCRGDEADDAVSQPGQWMQLDPLGHVVPSGIQSEQPIPGGLSSVQITEQGWGGEEGCSVAALPRVGDSSTCEMESSWLDSLLRSPPAPLYPLASSPRLFEEGMSPP